MNGDPLNFVLAHPNEAADRIEALEADLEEAERVDSKLLVEATDRIERLEAGLTQWVRQAEDNSGGWQRACLRIEALEAALRSAIEDLEWHGAVGEAERCRAALDKDEGK